METCRTNLVGEYLGHTEKNTKEAIEEARGGVLFIDEAYTLIEGGRDTKDYGKEVINALLTVLSEPNLDMIVILAGYEVLFIDEAYTLIEGGRDTKDYGKEVINALLTVLSEPNLDMIVILAGYENKMK